MVARGGLANDGTNHGQLLRSALAHTCAKRGEDEWWYFPNQPLVLAFKFSVLRHYKKVLHRDGKAKVNSVKKDGTFSRGGIRNVTSYVESSMKPSRENESGEGAVSHHFRVVIATDDGTFGQFIVVISPEQLLLTLKLGAYQTNKAY